MTRQELLAWGIENLEDASLEEARVDAGLLLEFALGITKNDIIMNPGDIVATELLERYRDCIDRRKKRVPLQYITGVQNFMGLDFVVSPDVLIPRFDTEILVEEIMKEGLSSYRILDMCTGSGAILLSLLKYSVDCTGVGVDISAGALQVAKENANRLGIDAFFLNSNLFEKIDKEEKFDIIVSNPPYIRSEVIDSLMPEVKDYEPRLALDGTEDGLFFYREISRDASSHLVAGGRLYYEIGYDQAEDVSKIMSEVGFCDINVVKDYAGLDRVVYGTRQSM